jgi:inorganic pyrophosphatase
MTVMIYEVNKEKIMNKDNIQEQVLKKINLILSEFKDYEQAFVDFKGDIIIKNKVKKTSKKEKLILTNIFKEIIANDIKKNRA